MPWNWQLIDWPHFFYDPAALLSLEQEFLQGIGGIFSILKLIDEVEKKRFIVEILSAEGTTSSEIEGEILQRDSLRSSILRHFGLKKDKRMRGKEAAMADLMCHVYDTYDQPLTHEMLYQWHALLFQQKSGQYRLHEEPMQILSNRYGDAHVYFEAPPSKQIKREMTRFISWFNQENGSILGKASQVHVYFESIHPFEDGNGRIGRALVEKALSQRLGHPTLIAISPIIERRKKEYYEELGRCNRTLDMNRWALFFSKILLQAQKESAQLVDFLIQKFKLMQKLAGKINKRQEKVLLRMFSEGLKGFTGGLSAENYIAIAKCSRATASRDLSDLVKKEALSKTGQKKYSRYHLKRT